LQHRVEQRRRLVVDRVHDRGQPTLVLGMLPARVVQRARGMQDQRRRRSSALSAAPREIAVLRALDARAPRFTPSAHCPPVASVVIARVFASATIRATSASSRFASYTMPSFTV